MEMRIYGLIAMLLCFGLTVGCTSTDLPETKSATIQYEFQQETENREAICKEGDCTAKEINDYLGWTIAADANPRCVFDNRHIYEGSVRSEYKDQVMYCANYCDFVHEYVHLICDVSGKAKYPPESMVREGFATYIEYIWKDEIAQGEYQYLQTDVRINRSSDPTENAQVEAMLEMNEMELTPENYRRALVQLAYERAGEKLPYLVDDSFVDYWIGPILVDFLITQQGGLKPFLGFYCESERAQAIYGRSLDKLVLAALKYNDSLFV